MQCPFVLLVRLGRWEVKEARWMKEDSLGMQQRNGWAHEFNFLNWLNFLTEGVPLWRNEKKDTIIRKQFSNQSSLCGLMCIVSFEGSQFSYKISISMNKILYQWCNDTYRPKKNNSHQILSRCHFVHYRPHIYWPGINTFAASYLNTQGLNNSCLKSPASTLVDLTFQTRALRSFSLNQLRNLSL